MRKKIEWRKVKMKKRLVSLLLTGIMVMSLAVGCSGSSGGSDDSEGSGEEEVTLRWMQFQVEYAEQVKNMAKAYEEEHPNVKIEVEVIGDDYYDILKTKASAGDMPDVFMTAGYNEINTYKEYITDLSDQDFVDNIAEIAKNVYKTIL